MWEQLGGLPADDAVMKEPDRTPGESALGRVEHCRDPAELHFLQGRAEP